MYNAFYIIETQEGWYQLCLKDTHYVLSSGSDLSRILMTLKDLVKRYRTKERLMRAVKKTEDRGEVSEKTKDLYEKWFSDLSGHYDYIVKKIVKEGLNEAKEYSTFNKTKKRLKACTLIEEKTPESLIPQVVKDPKPVAKKRLRIFGGYKRLGVNKV